MAYELNIGDRFGKLVVLQGAGSNENYLRMFLCQCDCGTEKAVAGSYLAGGRITSCGNCRDLVYGVGINDLDYVVMKSDLNGKIIWSCPFHSRWRSVLERTCYDKFKEKNQSYKDCTLHPDWIYSSVFKAWMETQDWQGKHLDKDLLIPGNKMYGPDTCTFIDQEINKFITESNAIRGEWPIGVNFDKGTGKFKAQCKSVVEGKKKHLGLFTTPEDAHKAWLDFKLEQAKILAEGQTDERVAKALIYRYEVYYPSLI